MCGSSFDISLASSVVRDDAAVFFVEANWGASQAIDVAQILGSRASSRLADDSQLPMRLNQQSTAKADSAFGGLTALQRELLERQVKDEMHERYFSATERLPAALFLASDATGKLVGCAGVEAAVVDRRRSLVVRRTRTPLKRDLKPDGSLPDGMEVRASLACHAVAADHRRRGIGTELFRRCASHSESWALGPLLLLVHEDDRDARGFYEAMGCDQVFRDAGAMATRAELPSPEFTRDVLRIFRSPSPMLALQWPGTPPSSGR